MLFRSLEWPIDILITVVWVSYAVVFFGTIMKRKALTETNSTKQTSAKTQKKITGDELAQILWEASTKCGPTILVQQESEKSRKFDTEEMRLIVR